MKIGDIFEPGNRKTTMTLIALIGTVVLEKFGGGLSDSLRDTILMILGIFTGGNVLSKGIRAAEEVKVAKYAQPEPMDVQSPPTEQNTSPEKEEEPVTLDMINKIIAHINKLDNAAGAEITALKDGQAKSTEAIEGLSARVDTQVENLSKVLNILNGMRNGNQQQA